MWAFHYLNIHILFILVYGTYFLIFFTQFVFSKKYFSLKSLSFIKFYAIKYKFKIFTLCLSVLLLTASATILRQGTPFIIGIIEGIGENVTVFSISLLIFYLFVQFISIPIGLVSPQAAYLFKRKQLTELLFIYQKFTVLTIFVALIGILLFQLSGIYLLEIWLSISSYNLLKIHEISSLLMIFFIMSIPTLYARSILSFVNLHMKVSILELLIIIFAFFISYILRDFFSTSLSLLIFFYFLYYLIKLFGPINILLKSFFRINYLELFFPIFKELLIFLLPVFFFCILFSFLFNKYLIFTFALLLLIPLTYNYYIRFSRTTS
jgi:hypothetical protein